jgi:hypothetical protein
VWIKSLLFSRVWVLNKSPFTKPRLDGENDTQAGFVVSQLITKKLKPHLEAGFVKEL